MPAKKQNDWLMIKHKLNSKKKISLRTRLTKCAHASLNSIQTEATGVLVWLSEQASKSWSIQWSEVWVWIWFVWGLLLSNFFFIKLELYQLNKTQMAHRQSAWRERKREKKQRQTLTNTSRKPKTHYNLNSNSKWNATTTAKEKVSTKSHGWRQATSK